MYRWLKVFLIIITFALISVSLYFLLRIFGLTNISKIKEIILVNRKYSLLFYIVISSIVLVFFCFIPLLNTALVVLGIVIFGSKTTFIVSMIAVFISSTALFFIGDKLGEGFAKKLIGEKDLLETQNLIDHKSKFWLPILFIIPGIPDEALCLVAGMTKMKYWYLILISMLYHAIEFGIICFIGSGIINWAALTIVDWFILINLIIIDIILLYKLEKKLDKKK